MSDPPVNHNTLHITRFVSTPLTAILLIVVFVDEEEEEVEGTGAEEVARPDRHKTANLRLLISHEKRNFDYKSSMRMGTLRMGGEGEGLIQRKMLS